MNNNYSFTYEESGYSLVPEAAYEAILSVEKKISPITPKSSAKGNGSVK